MMKTEFRQAQKNNPDLKNRLSRMLSFLRGKKKDQ